MTMEFPDFNKASDGNAMYELIEKLYPICRSITGNGVRQSLKIIKEHIPIEIKEVKTGTAVFDWEVPKEWNIKDAYVKDSNGKKILDFKDSNLHVVGYSTPVRERMGLKELKEHLHSLPEYPDWIPYLTSYYRERWGFCLSHKQYLSLEDGEYEVFIDSELKDGNLTYGELVIPGESKTEVLLSTYVCHPSLCNDNLTGPAILTFIAKNLLLCKNKPRYTYRLLFIPETIGAITWISNNQEVVKHIKAGLILTCGGDSGPLTYKKSKEGNSEIDAAALHALEESGKEYRLMDFSPNSDERQFSSPGINIPCGSIMRTPYTQYPQYHTSADNLEFVNGESLADTLQEYLRTIFILDNNLRYLSKNPNCEPQLGKRGLYRTLGSQKKQEGLESAMLWLMLMADGKKTLLDISAKSGIEFRIVCTAAELLSEAGLLEKSRVE